ncbi:hypothetical protein [Singulisphaera sp. PoT]|uniref:hypothetical protein n=1 Tax=Singulisphaera sp. PoT TaxID=3411797 RepID=UPI003BF50C7B
MLDLITAAPKAIRFGDRILKVGALKLRELGLLQRWIRDHSVRPTVAVKAVLEFYEDAAERRQVMKQAVIDERYWPPSIGTPDGNGVLFDDLEGQEYFLGVMLRKYQPLTDEELSEILGGISHDDFGMLVRVAFGEDDLDPEEIRRQQQAKRLAALAREDPEGSTSGSSSTDTSQETPTSAPATSAS